MMFNGATYMQRGVELLMTYAVIMAGGRGERFWPKSRKILPKQFLCLFGDKTMLQKTVQRIKSFLPPDRIYIVAAQAYEDLVRQQVPEIPETNLIVEPYGRDTAAAVGLATVVVARRDPQGVMLVLPADHYIADEIRFKEILQGAVEAATGGEHLVTMGIQAIRPETGFGYIACGPLYGRYAGVPAYLVEQFTEKPDRERALSYLDQGNYYWNSGIFIWRVDLIERLIGQHIPELSTGLAEIRRSLDSSDHQQVLKQVYQKVPRVSIDYGVMEKADNVLMLPGNFGWDDVGSWTALDAYKEKDDQGNVLDGRGVLVDTKNTMVQASEKVVATLGVKDLIIVESDESILVCHKSRAQEIKKLIRALEDNGYKEIL
jgi:mannose-1-phosphate guanylyltransferase